MTVILLIGMVSVIIRNMFHGRIYLNSVLLLLLVKFEGGFSLELMYISLIVTIKSRLIHSSLSAKLLLSAGQNISSTK